MDQKQYDDFFLALNSIAVVYKATLNRLTSQRMVSSKRHSPCIIKITRLFPSFIRIG